jgi:peptidyl-dipeptidase A
LSIPHYKLPFLNSSIDINDEETNINMLFDLALDRLAFLPFGYLVDKYRWDLMSGKVSYDDMNCHWHKLR